MRELKTLPALGEDVRLYADIDIFGTMASVFFFFRRLEPSVDPDTGALGPWG
jgi:hypothetical protein